MASKLLEHVGAVFATGWHIDLFALNLEKHTHGRVQVPFAHVDPKSFELLL